MHIAIAHKKFRVIERPESSRWPMEDIVTSMFFGTLQYLPSEDIAYYLSTIVQELGLTYTRNDVSDADVDAPIAGQIDFSFWPNTASSGRVEPDVTVSCSAGLVERLILECKWGAGLSGDEQLLLQWQSLSPEERNKSLHIVIVREGVDSILSDTNRAAWNERIGAISWQTMIGLARIVGQERQGALTKWAGDMSRMFVELGVVPFRGFSYLIPSAISEAPSAIAYWHDFGGVSTIPMPDSADQFGTRFGTPIFWTAQEGS